MVSKWFSSCVYVVETDTSKEDLKRKTVFFLPDVSRMVAAMNDGIQFIWPMVHIVDCCASRI